jgi:hypothetical protein
MSDDSKKQNEELRQALDAFKAGTHTHEQFMLLMDALPPETRKEMDRQAGEILGINFSKPDSYSEDGQPLFHINPDDLATRLGMAPEEAREDLDAFLADAAKRGTPMPKPDPRVSVIKGGIKLKQPLFVESDEKDEDGNPIFMCSMEGAGVMLVDAALQHNTTGEAGPRSVEIFNRWMTLARQRGVSSIIIERLREATKVKTSSARVLADVVRVTKKVSAIEAFQGGAQ